MSITITNVIARDIRFPTSATLDGSDAVNIDPDYSATYVILETDNPRGLRGYGLAFTNARGNEVCVAAVQALKHHVQGRTLQSLTENFGAFWNEIASDSQVRWLGPEKGVIHLATAALVNAVWDLYAKTAGKPLWKLLVDMTAEQIVACIDFHYLTDVLTPEGALAIVRANAPTRHVREAEMLRDGFPAYTTSAGWMGYSDAKIISLAQAAMDAGFTHLKLKVGADPVSDLRRARALRKAIGPNGHLMLDANQVWSIGQAIEAMRSLAEVNPWWIEEPTSPDDVLGHQRIREAIAPIRVATGEHVQNRAIFKQLFQAKATYVCQIDSCRFGV